MVTTMRRIDSHTSDYVLAALLGVIGGGLIVALATRALPRMMSRMMSGMMRTMMSQMGGSGCDPAEM